jgi:hypothetical protein
MAEEGSIAVDTCHIIYMKNVSVCYDYHLTVQEIADEVRILVGNCHIIINEDPDTCFIIRRYRGWQRKSALELILATLSTLRM